MLRLGAIPSSRPLAETLPDTNRSSNFFSGFDATGSGSCSRHVLAHETRPPALIPSNERRIAVWLATICDAIHSKSRDPIQRRVTSRFHSRAFGSRLTGFAAFAERLVASTSNGVWRAFSVSASPGFERVGRGVLEQLPVMRNAGTRRAVSAQVRPRIGGAISCLTIRRRRCIDTSGQEPRFPPRFSASFRRRPSEPPLTN